MSFIKRYGCECKIKKKQFIMLTKCLHVHRSLIAGMSDEFISYRCLFSLLRWLAFFLLLNWMYVEMPVIIEYELTLNMISQLRT